MPVLIDEGVPPKRPPGIIRRSFLRSLLATLCLVGFRPIGVAACQRPAVRILRYGVVGTTPTLRRLDPIASDQSDAERFVSRCIFGSLIEQVQSDDDFRLYLADAVNAAPDREGAITEFEVSLGDHSWSDGRPITIDEAAQSISAQLAGVSGDDAASQTILVELVERILVLDDTTLVVMLKQPCVAGRERHFAMDILAPMRGTVAPEVDFAHLPDDAVLPASGRYSLNSLKGATVTLNCRPDTGAPFDRIEVHVYRPLPQAPADPVDQEALAWRRARNDLKAGHIDVLGPARHWDASEAVDRLRQEDSEIRTALALTFDTVVLSVRQRKSTLPLPGPPKPREESLGPPQAAELNLWDAFYHLAGSSSIRESSAYLVLPSTALFPVRFNRPPQIDLAEPDIAIAAGFFAANYSESIIVDPDDPLHLRIGEALVVAATGIGGHLSLVFARDEFGRSHAEVVADPKLVDQFNMMITVRGTPSGLGHAHFFIDREPNRLRPRFVLSDGLADLRPDTWGDLNRSLLERYVPIGDLVARYATRGPIELDIFHDASLGVLTGFALS